jgi:hypothetical protein
MWCAVLDREGKLLLINATDTAGTPQSPNGSDAWRDSIEIAIAKTYTAMAFSSKQQAIDSRTLGLLSRLDVPPTGGSQPGHEYGAGATVWHRRHEPLLVLDRDSRR